MTPRRMLAVITCLSMWTSATEAGSFPTPTAETLQDLGRVHHPNDWWRITADSTRYVVRVGRIDAGGVAGLTSRRETPPAPEQIAWRSIGRIDARTTARASWRRRGVLLGGLGMMVQLVANDSDNRYLYMLAGGIVGGVIGDRLGAQRVTYRPLYLAPTAPIVPAATATPVATAQDSLAPEVSHAAPAAADPAAVGKACRKLYPSQLLRIDGEFGRFHGYAANARPEGLSGLRVETKYPSVDPPQPLGWERIDVLQVQGSRAGSSARRGAIVVGTTFGFIGFLVRSALGPEHSNMATPDVVALSALSGAAIGGVIGAAIGSMRSAWHVAYRRPSADSRARSGAPTRR